MKLVATIVLLGACAAGGPGSAGFRVFYPDAGAQGIRGKVGVPMQARPAADCKNKEGGEARWATVGARVTDGELPPGIAIEDGAIGGTPTTEGTWRASVTFTGVTCAAAPRGDQTVDVSFTVAVGHRVDR